MLDTAILRSSGSNAAPYAERRDPVDPPSALDGFLTGLAVKTSGLLKAGQKQLAALADRVLAQADEAAAIAEGDFPEAMARCRARLMIDGLSNDNVVEAFALTREATRRVMGFCHHRVQVIGGLAMLAGRLAEMETGEGKTITALLPAATAALAGTPVHVVTVNDYLADRDASELRPIYTLLGLSVGLVAEGLEADERRGAYRRDITYCTNKDLVFDYLRDQLTTGKKRGAARRLIHKLRGRSDDDLLLRGLHFAIIDEADSVLIDEARTPLILSASQDTAGQAELRALALEIAGTLIRNLDFKLVPRTKDIQLLPSGEDKLTEASRGLPGIWIARRARNELIVQALMALHIYRRDVNYIVADDKIAIIDEYTGRVMPDRSWENGLHQMVEIKEGCPPTAQRQTIARITYQRFFGRYLRLAGMTGTIQEAAGEVGATLGLRTMRIDTNYPLRRLDLGTVLLENADEKWRAVAHAARCQAQDLGRPVLVGTRSVGASEELSRVLSRDGIDHLVLNARQDKDEAEVIAAAGQTGRITVATNMAGRGTDIKLTAPARAAGGLHVILTEFHESARIDRQLFGRCARQGDPGSYQAIVALDDEIFTRFLGAPALAKTLLRIGGSKLNAHVASLLRWWAQGAAERHNRRIRLNTVRQDHELERALAFAGPGE